MAIHLNSDPGQQIIIKNNILAQNKYTPSGKGKQQTASVWPIHGV